MQVAKIEDDSSLVQDPVVKLQMQMEQLFTMMGKGNDTDAKLDNPDDHMMAVVATSVASFTNANINAWTRETDHMTCNENLLNSIVPISNPICC